MLTAKNKGIWILSICVGLAALLIVFLNKAPKEPDQPKDDGGVGQTLARHEDKAGPPGPGNDLKRPVKIYSGRVEREHLEQSIKMAADYLVAICNPEGKFQYRVNMDPDVWVKPKYNMLRHAGTVYALVKYHQWKPDNNVRAAAVRAMKFLQRQGLRPVPENEGLSAVWTRPELSGRDEPLKAKLGGTGLGLLAALSVEKIAPNTTPVKTLKQMGLFIKFMQKDDGSFYSLYIPESGGKNDDFVSLYYPGEAALGLIMLYEFDNSTVWLNSALRALGYLAEIRKGKSVVEADHWALMATQLMLKHYEKTDKSISRELLVDHALQIASGIIENRWRPSLASVLNGTLGRDGRTTPTATRLEGLLAISDLLAPSAGREDPAQVIEHAISFLLRSQVREGKYRGAITRELLLDRIKGPGYNNRATEIRIDYIQHALCAMLDYIRFIDSRPVK
jgi:hypothetical protein